MVTTLMSNTKGDGSGGDPFWEKSERLLLTAVESDLGLCGFLSFLVATALAQSVNFFVQKNFVFKFNAAFGKAVPQYVLRAVVLVIVSAALPAYSQAFFVQLGVPGSLAPTLANIVNIVVQVVVSYPTMKFWVMLENA